MYKKKSKQNKKGTLLFFHFDFAISRAAFIRGDNVLRGSDSLKKGCYNEFSFTFRDHVTTKQLTWRSCVAFGLLSASTSNVFAR
jgi:hypothetical protein